MNTRVQEKAEERERVLGLYRRGRIDDASLDRQLDLIYAETKALQAEIESANRAMSLTDAAAQLHTAEALLDKLRSRLQAPISPELKRRTIEILVESIQAKTVERWGVQQSELVITYRFSTEQAVALVFPRLHRLSTRNSVPEQLNTIGDHLRRRRLTLKLLQREVADQIGVDKSSLHNWETNRTKPDLKFVPAIIQFLGYNPIPTPSDLAARLVSCRTALGMSQNKAAIRLGVDASTLHLRCEGAAYHCGYAEKPEEV